MSIGSKHEVAVDRIWAINGGGRSTGREPGSDDEDYGRGNDDVPF